MENIRKLPLWKSLLETLIEQGVSHGKVYSAEYFEQELSCQRESREFGIAVYRIRMGLEQKGFYLQGHVTKDGNLVIVPPEKHVGIAKATESRIRKNRTRSVMLLSATRRELLPEKLRHSHDKLLMRIQIKELIERRADKIHGYLQKKAPKLLGI